MAYILHDYWKAKRLKIEMIGSIIIFISTLEAGFYGFIRTSEII